MDLSILEGLASEASPSPTAALRKAKALENEVFAFAVKVLGDLGISEDDSEVFSYEDSYGVSFEHVVSIADYDREEAVEKIKVLLDSNDPQGFACVLDIHSLSELKPHIPSQSDLEHTDYDKGYRQYGVIGRLLYDLDVYVPEGSEGYNDGDLQSFTVHVFNDEDYAAKQLRLMADETAIGALKNGFVEMQKSALVVQGRGILSDDILSQLVALENAIHRLEGTHKSAI